MGRNIFCPKDCLFENVPTVCDKDCHNAGAKEFKSPEPIEVMQYRGHFQSGEIVGRQRDGKVFVKVGDHISTMEVDSKLLR